MNELNIHTRLKEARKFLNLNQLSIAKDLNMLQKTISEIENGKLLNIPNKYIYYFAENGISLNWIYDGSGLMMKNDLNPIRNEETENKSDKKHFEDPDHTKMNISETDKKSGGQLVTKPTGLIADLANNVGSKDFAIQSLLSYIKSQENTIDFLQKIVSKELGL